MGLDIYLSDFSKYIFIRIHIIIFTNSYILYVNIYLYFTKWKPLRNYRFSKITQWIICFQNHLQSSTSVFTRTHHHGLMISFSETAQYKLGLQISTGSGHTRPPRFHMIWLYNIEFWPVFLTFNKWYNFHPPNSYFSSSYWEKVVHSVSFVPLNTFSMYLLW